MLAVLKHTVLAVCALLPAAALAQGTLPPTADHYYLNGQPSTKKVVEALQKSTPKRIASVNVLQGKEAVAYTHDPSSKSAILVTTK